MEEERPLLYSEAVGQVEPAGCKDHLSCVRSSNRYRDLVTRGEEEEEESGGLKSTNSCDSSSM